MQQTPNPENRQGVETAKVLSIVGLVVSIFAFVFSFIPCFGYYAIGPAIFAMLFSIVPLIILRKAGRKIYIPLITLGVSAVALGVGIYQRSTFNQLFEAKDEINEAFKEHITEAVLDSLNRKMEEMNDSIKQYEREHDSIQW